MLLDAAPWSCSSAIRMRTWPLWFAAAAAAFTLVACKSEDAKEREYLAPYLPTARPFLDAVRKAQTPPGPLAACANKPASQPTVLFSGPVLKKVFDLSKPYYDSDSVLLDSPQGHPCWTFGANKSLRPFEYFVQKGELDPSGTGKTVAGAHTTADCAHGIASFIVTYTTERTDIKLISPKNYEPGHAAVRAVVFSKAGAPTCEQSFDLYLNRVAIEDPTAATDLEIDLQSARLVRAAFGLPKLE